tara:strand:- start:111 stop:551 length:441 start_codon:yes stop_codon:yes gene_type:complete
MRIVIQRVQNAEVIINNKLHSSIDYGLLCLVGFCDTDNVVDLEWALKKITTLKLFNNQLSLDDVEGELLIVSQFTLFASVKKGTKPSWYKAAKPDHAKEIYNSFVSICRDKLFERVKTGFFGADMKIKSTNDGPVTIIIDTKNKDY